MSRVMAIACAIVVVALIAQFVAFRVREVQGICAANGRVLSDDAFLDITLRERIGTDRANYLGNADYESPEDFLRRNPQCCRVYRAGDMRAAHATRVGRILFKQYYVTVQLHYRRSSLEAPRPDYFAGYLMDECGEILDFTGYRRYELLYNK